MIDLIKVLALAFWRMPLKDKLCGVWILCRLVPYLPLILFVCLFGRKDGGDK